MFRKFLKDPRHSIAIVSAGKMIASFNVRPEMVV